MQDVLIDMFLFLREANKITEIVNRLRQGPCVLCYHVSTTVPQGTYWCSFLPVLLMTTPKQKRLSDGVKVHGSLGMELGCQPHAGLA